MKALADQEVLDRIHEGFRRVGLTFPYLAGLIQTVRVQLDQHVETMGIFASGRLLVNPDFVRSLSARDLVFVLSHELYHLMLRSHDRWEGTNPLDFNVAHDFIINDLLRTELQYDQIPAGGADWSGARLLSAEKILGEMRRDPWRLPNPSWGPVISGGWAVPDSEDGATSTDRGRTGQRPPKRPGSRKRRTATSRRGPAPCRSRPPRPRGCKL